MSVYRGICPHGAYGEVLDINDALCVGQMLISGHVGRNRNGSSNRAHWEWEKQEKQDIKDKKKIQTVAAVTAFHCLFSLQVFVAS